MTRNGGHEGAPQVRRPSCPGLVAAGGLLGLAGVAVSAAAAHGGGDLAKTAGQFCLLHAAAVMGLAAYATSAPPGRLFMAAAWILVGGTAVFAGDLAVADLGHWRPLPPAAPLGGGLLLVGWLVVAIGGVVSIFVGPGEGISGVSWRRSG